MGVKGLQTFVEACPAVFRWVDLVQMAADYRKTHDEIPVIVVDGNNCLNVLIERVEWVCGGQWDEYLEILRDFLAAFEKIGIKLVFFFDGQPPRNEHELWLFRRHEKMEQHKQIFAKVKSSAPLLDMYIIPAGLPYAVPIALKYVLQATVYCNVDEESDRTIASYAAKNQCLAILAQDSDYIIYSTVPYVSMNHLVLKTMRTRMYCRNALCRELGIDLQMLPLFACLVGTDYISREILSKFHHRICANRFIRGLPRIHTTVRCVAEYVAKYADVSQENPSHDIAEMYNSLEIQDAISLADFKRRLDVYSLDFNGTSGYIYPGSKERETQNDQSIYDVLVRKVKNGELLPKMLNVIFSGREIRNPSLEDANADDKLAPCVLVYRPLRQRMYCLMLNFKEKYFDNDMFVPHMGALIPTSQDVEEWWVNPSKNDDKGKEVVLPEPLNLMGGLSNAALMLDIIMGKSVRSEKWTVFMACLKLTMTSATFQRIPHPYKSLCAILNYLVQQHDVPLKLWEVDVFLIHAIHPKFTDKGFHKQLQLLPYNPRAVHLATLFLRGAEALFDLLWFCGNPIEIDFFMPWHFFNGKFFHWIYKCISMGDGSKVELNGDALAMFHQLRAATFESIDLKANFPK